MKKRMKVNRKQMAALLALAAVMLVWIWLIIMPAEAAGGENGRKAHVLTYYDTRYNDGLLRVGYFEIDGGTVAMCVCHELEPPTQSGTPLSTVASYTADNKGNELLRKIYYYGWHGPKDVGASYVETCLAGSVANGHDDNYYGYGQAFINRIASLPSAPKGFEVYILSDGINTTQNLAYWEYHPTGFVMLKKSDLEAGLTEGNLCYSLQGAKYGVYRDETCGNQVAVLTTDAEGKTNTAELEPGTWYIKEIEAPRGYRLDDTVYPVTVTEQKTQTVETEDMPVWDELGLSIFKQDAEREEGTPLGAASLEGAQFQVCYYAGYYSLEDLPDTPKRTWILETRKEESEGTVKYSCKLNEMYLVQGDEFYMAQDQVILPLGTITVEEIKAPAGYLLEENYYTDQTDGVWKGKYLTQIRQDSDDTVMDGGNVCIGSDYVIRGDLELVKIGDKTHKRLSNVPFQITSNTTGECHIILTDENGQASTASSWNLHSESTNRGEESGDGVWFGMKSDGNTVEIDDSKGALPFDTYTVEELRCESNQGYELIPPFTVTVKKNRTTVHLGTMTNDEEKEEKPEEPEQPEETKQTEEKEPAAEKKVPSVRTGDETNASTWLIACILSCMAVMTCVMIARRIKKR